MVWNIKQIKNRLRLKWIILQLNAYYTKFYYSQIIYNLKIVEFNF